MKDDEHCTYDYDNQAWLVNGRYVRCGHPNEMNCQCFDRLHAGEPREEDNRDDRPRVR